MRCRIGIFMLAIMILLCSCAEAVEKMQVTAAQAEQALKVALEYAEFDYVYRGQSYTGMPYRLGGRTTLSELEEALILGESIDNLGLDASGLVVNCYREVLPDAKFLFKSDQGFVPVTDVNSYALFNWNVSLQPLEELRPGDLIFFKSEKGRIMGVGILVRTTINQVRCVVASETSGKITETGMMLSGSYWNTHYAGGGRLNYVK
ncbi:MAG: C40 family peptidase [Limnochordia bacterium]|nr:C40 family peptidase [Limnochordia bacterium]